MRALEHSWYMGVRDMRALLRQPWWIAISLAQPLVYLLIYTQLFQKVTEIPGFQASSYIDFFAPGVVIVTALFSGSWAGMSVIQDLDRGVVDRFLVSPVTRSALIAGRLMQQALVAIIQSLIIVVISLALGASYPGGVFGVVVLFLAAVLLGASFGALSIAAALVMRKEESVIGAVQLLVLPLTFLSSVFMQRSLMPSWMQDVASFNPVEWATTAGRAAVSADRDWSMIGLHGLYLLLFATFAAGLATTSFRSYQRSV